jgi:hypothetical protein
LIRFSTGALALLMAIGFGLNAALAAPAPVSHAAQGNIGPYASAVGTASLPKVVAESSAGVPPADFGSPPSGEIPILFNDHHVYTKPDRLKANRVLAALVRGNTILIPLRSMFEQMGGTVSYDPGSKTVDVSKPGSDVKVTVGRPEVIINGESRPLDVPPEIYRGVVVVPVRVISEGMGAYVQWIPDRRLVVVRYVVATPPPPPPTPAPTAVPSPTPTPVPTPKPYSYEHFVAADAILAPTIYNEFNPGKQGTGFSGQVRAATEFSLWNIPWMVEGQLQQWYYQHNISAAASAGLGLTPYVPGTGTACPGGEIGCVTNIGATGQVFTNAFAVKDWNAEGRFGLKVADPRIYVGVGYLYRSNNYGYPKQAGVGAGLEKLPDLDKPLSVFGSFYYYPQVQGSYTDGNSLITYKLQYQVLSYQVGATYDIMKSPVFVEGGWGGDKGVVKQFAPSPYLHYGWFAGLGVHF